jgi:hypothetical protein
VAPSSWFCGNVDTLAVINHPQAFSALAKMTSTQLEVIGLKFDVASSDF